MHYAGTRVSPIASHCLIALIHRYLRREQEIKPAFGLLFPFAGRHLMKGGAHISADDVFADDDEAVPMQEEAQAL